MNDSALFGMLGLLIGGAGVWAVMRVKLASLVAEADFWFGYVPAAEDELFEIRDAHSRLSDAHNSTKERIERALECETANAAHGVRKMAAILRGER